MGWAGVYLPMAAQSLVIMFGISEVFAIAKVWAGRSEAGYTIPCYTLSVAYHVQLFSILIFSKASFAAF